MEKESALILVRNAILEKARIPIHWCISTIERPNALNFELHFVDYRFDYMNELREVFNNIIKKSSVGNRFSWDGEKITTDWGYCIQLGLIAYPRKGEKVEDLVTLLKLEGVI